MKIILLKNIDKLGKEGDLVDVKDGYGRNYLLPLNMALPGNKENLKKIDKLKEKREKQQAKEKENLAKIKEKINNLSITITAEAKDDESLYGTVTKLQIQNLLQKEGLELNKEKIILDKAIDKLGVYKIPVAIAPDIESVFRLWVVRK